jgi:D-threonate/D-erythronate kinase
MPSLKLLADDLTGALDTSAELVGVVGPLSVVWSAALLEGQQSFAIDSGTREHTADEAFAVVREIAPLLAGADIAYKKIDSLLRGPWVAELDACLRTGLWDACIVAPAFVHQGRVTRSGQQYAKAHNGSWSAVGKNIIEQLRERGLEAKLASPTATLQNGISVFDAETEKDLDHIAEIGRGYAGRLLWCGSGGLANALARGSDVSVPAKLETPVLGIFGSDHAATAAQLSMCAGVVIGSADVGQDLDRIRRALDKGVAFVRLDTPGTVSRTDAAKHFARAVAQLCESIDPPKTLIVAGGETLKALTSAVGAGARALQVHGRLEPGLPKSVIQGGRWAGVDVLSKSGAFGSVDLWSKLLRLNGLI